MHEHGSALITGGAGFIGSHLAEHLLERGMRVSVIDDLSTGDFDNIAHLAGRHRFSFAIDSITDEVVMDRLVSECSVVFHLAAAVGVELIVSDPVHVIETNILGTHQVLKLANRYRKQALLASTSEIYGKSDHVPFREDDDRLLGPVTKARWSYASSKTVDEFLGLAYHEQKGLPVTICRLFNTVGPRQTGQYGMVLPRFVQQGLAGKPLTVYGDGRQQRCFCNVSDAVEAIAGLAATPSAAGQVFNVGSTEELTILELARRVLALIDETADEEPVASIDDRIVLVPYEEAYGEGFEDMRRRVPDIARIREKIGWEPRVSLEDTIRQVIDYYRNREAAPATPAEIIG